MLDISAKYDTYAEVIRNSMQLSILFLVLFFVALVGTILLLGWWYKGIKKERSGSVPDEFKSTRKEKLEILIPCAIVLVLIVCGSVTAVREIVDRRYDMDNNAYVVVDGDFSIRSQRYSFGHRGNAPVYTLIYEQDGQRKEVDIVMDYCELTEGEYTDTVLVYSSRAKIVVDVISGEDTLTEKG